MKYTGIHHISLYTRDMDATIRFWRDLLEAPMVVLLGRPSIRRYYFSLSPNSMISFAEWLQLGPERDELSDAREYQPFDHLSIGLDARGDLWKTKDRLDDAGLKTSDVIDHGFMFSFYVRDPNGIPVEFSCPKPGINVLAKPLVLDKDPTPAAKEGSQPQPGHWPSPEEPKAPAARNRKIIKGEYYTVFSSDSEEMDNDENK